MRLLGRGSFLPHNGKDMELYGAVPPRPNRHSPGDLPSGNDPPNSKAIEVLQQEVKEKGSEVVSFHFVQFYSGIRSQDTTTPLAHNSMPRG